ncbi:MAG: pitrilysin family protein [Chthoniobacteraceae bacterium]
MLTLPLPAAEVFTLPNGLTLIVEEDHSAPVVSVQAWVQTGSIHEGRWLGGGISHLLEHMLFKGTPRRGASEFAQAVQDQGGYINAYTSFDRTVYWVDVPARGAAIAIELLADAIQNSTLPPDELVKEREVIRREFAMGFDDADRMASQALFDTAYVAHPYRHPVIGRLDVFNQLTHDDLARYYRERYAPNNVFFVVVGDVKAVEIEALLAATFSTPRRALPDVFIPAEPSQLGRRDMHREFPTELTRLHLAWHVPDITHPDVPSLDVAAVALGGGRSSRLYQRLREVRGIVHSIDTWCWSPTETGLFGIDAILEPAHRAEVERECLGLIDQVRTNGVSEAEIEKARKIALSHQLGQFTTMRGKAGDIGANWLLTRNLHFSHDYLEAIQQVSADSVRRAIERHCRESNLVVTSLSPEGSTAKTTNVASIAAGGEIQRFELPNGLRLLVREDPRLPLISIATTFKAGLLAETPEINGITRLFARTLLKGTPTRTAEQIADELESLGGGIGAEGGNNSINVTVRVMQPDLARGLSILSEVLREATLPEKAISREREVQLGAIKADEEEVTSVARNLLRQHLFAGHPFGMTALGTPETVAKITRDDLLAFRDRHLCARNGVLAIFGAVKAGEVREMVERELAAFRSGEPAVVAPPQPAPLRAASEFIEIMPKQQAVLMTGFLSVDLTSPDRAPLELIDEACSDLGSRLFLRIREQMGLAYFVGTGQLMGLSRGGFTFYLGTDPAKLEEVKGALHEEIAKLASDGLTAEELARAKAKLNGGLDIRNQSNDALAFSCALDELYGLGFDHYTRWRGEVDAVTLEDIRRVARKYFAEQPGITAIVRPA